jgi:hypothetical protein
MPIHVDIKINDKLINSLHIGRLRGGTKWDDINDYLVIEGDTPVSFSDWEAVGVPFQHRYGDGAEVCVMKAIQAIKNVEKNDYEDYAMTAEEFFAYLDKLEEGDASNKNS